jgi:two-component system, OmpR family, sensor histidine kinase CssS
MNRKLSTRILIPNLFIVIGSLLLLVLVMLFTVRIFLLQETSKEFKKVRTTMDLIIEVRKQKSIEDALTQEVIDMTVRQTSVLFADVRALILTPDMKYTSNATKRPLDEAALMQVNTDGSIVTIHSKGSNYLATAILFKTPDGDMNLMIYTSLDKINNLVMKLALIMLPALTGALLLALLASIYVSKRIAGPLRKLSRWAHGIGGRQYDRFEHRYDTVEIDFLAESLNGMAKRLEDYDAAQKIFLQNASHELRTPLMSIQGYAEGIKHGVFSDTAYAADIIIAESLRLSALVDDLLFLSKLETADGFYAFAPVSIGEILGQCAEKLEGAAIKEDRELALLPCPEAYVNGDGEKLLRAIMNLTGNCLRYAATKAVLAADVAGAKVVITVSDDGPGFDSEDLKNLFSRFYKGKQGKFGLGLSIAKAIVEKHGGTISAANGEAGGAIFKIELPLIEMAKNKG